MDAYVGGQNRGIHWSSRQKKDWFLDAGSQESDATQVACGRTSLRREGIGRRAKFWCAALSCLRGGRQNVSSSTFPQISSLQLFIHTAPSAPPQSFSSPPPPPLALFSRPASFHSSRTPTPGPWLVLFPQYSEILALALIIISICICGSSRVLTLSQF